jgi:hypothetical protein
MPEPNSVPSVSSCKHEAAILKCRCDKQFLTKYWREISSFLFWIDQKGSCSGKVALRLCKCPTHVVQRWDEGCHAESTAR